MASGSAGVVVELTGLTKRFGSLTAVDDLSFTVAPGQITGFLGPNGAGKTTTLRMLLGLVRPTSGTATIDGRAYADLDRPLAVVGAALEATDVHPGRSGRDHLRTIAAAAGVADSRVDELLEMTGIPAFARKRAGGYSTGMRQRLALAQSLLGDPQLLVLDEPANGLDPEGIRWLRCFLRHLCHDQGKTVLVSSHLLQEVEQTVDDVVIIANGNLGQAGRDGRSRRRRRRTRPYLRPGRAGRCSGARARRGGLRARGGRRCCSSTRPTCRRSATRRCSRAAGLGAPAPRGRPRGAVLRAHRGPQPQRRGGGVTASTVAAVRSELLKYFTTRLWWGMAIGIFVSGAAFAAVVRVALHLGELPRPVR